MEFTELVFIDDSGYHCSDYPSFLSWLTDKYKGIYGADVYLESDSQDGQWIAVQAKALYDTAMIGASVYNSFSPSTAQGVGLSRVVKINGLRRLIPSYSTVVLTIVGQAGTVIENGIAKDTLGQKWLLPVLVTIPDAGTVDATSTAELVGDVTAIAGSVTTIFTPTRGWQTVTNADAATPGAPVESDARLRVRQSVSTALPSLTVIDGTVGAISNLEGVTKVGPYENDTDTTDGDGLPEHSICMVVAGGDDVEIANAIAVHKTPGCYTFGDVPIQVFDAHGMPLIIRFQRALTATINVEITISVNNGWSSDFAGLIKAAVAATISAGEIGKTILITKLYSPAYLGGLPAGQTFDIATLEIGKNADPLAAANITLLFNENPVCDPDTNVTVIIT